MFNSIVLYKNRTSDLDKAEKLIEQLTLKVDAQCQQIDKLTKQRSDLEFSLKQIQFDLNELRSKYQSSANLIQQTCKSNATLKEENENLNKLFNDWSMKYRQMKAENERMSEISKKLESQNVDLQIDVDLTCKKMDELKKLYEMALSEKESYSKELNQSRIEVNNLQNNFKTLNRRFMQTITEKDSQIAQMQQALICNFFVLFIIF